MRGIKTDSPLVHPVIIVASTTFFLSVARSLVPLHFLRIRDTLHLRLVKVVQKTVQQKYHVTGTPFKPIKSKYCKTLS